MYEGLVPFLLLPLAGYQLLDSLDCQAAHLFADLEPSPLHTPALRVLFNLEDREPDVLLTIKSWWETPLVVSDT